MIIHEFSGLDGLVKTFGNIEQFQLITQPKTWTVLFSFPKTKTCNTNTLNQSSISKVNFNNKHCCVTGDSIALTVIAATNHAQF